MEMPDAYRVLSSADVLLTGVSAASAVAPARSQMCRIASTTAVRFVVGPGTPVATATSTLLAPNQPEFLLIGANEKVAALANDGTSATLNISFLSR